MPRLHSQMVPAFFRRVPPRSDLATSCGKARCWLVQAVHEEMVHVSRYAGTRVVPGDGKPPRFCLECRCRAFANPRLVLLAAFSRPLSRCYPLSYCPPLLCLFCVDGTSSAQRTSSVISLHMQILHREDVREGGSTVRNSMHQGGTALIKRRASQRKWEL